MVHQTLQAARAGAVPGRRPVIEPGPRIEVALGPVAGIGSTYRVAAPARVLRMWGMLNQASQELSAHDLPLEAVARLHGVFVTVTAELRHSVSPALRTELDQLIGSSGDGADVMQVRIEYASLLGWLGGLVISMLGELDTASWSLSLMSAAPPALPRPRSRAVRRDSGGEGSPPSADRRRTVRGGGPYVPLRLPRNLDPSPYL
jgi:Protein of unknown function (DUF2587)